MREGIQTGHAVPQDRPEMQAAREENALLQVCRAFAQSSKLIVTVADGSVVGPFFGSMLAGDFRITTNRSSIVFPHVKFRMAPLGAIAYYLPRYIGPSLADLISCLARPCRPFEPENWACSTP